MTIKFTVLIGPRATVIREIGCGVGQQDAEGAATKACKEVLQKIKQKYYGIARKGNEWQNN